jgi:VanZ family protein
VLLFGPAGFLAARVLVERGHPPARAGLLAVAAGALAWSGAEVMRGLSGADMRAWAVVLRTTATALGALVAAAYAGREEAGARGWLAGLHHDARAYVALLALWTLRPFAPVAPAAALAKLTPDAFVPLRAVAQLWSLHSVADVAIGFCLFLPVGAWLAVHPRRDGRRRTPWVGLALAAFAEFAQIGVAGRYFDVTDILVQGAGVLVGWAIVLRADARRSRMAAPSSAQSALGNVSGGSSLGASAARSSGSTARVASKW